MGVVLACGGFEADPGLADAYLPLGPTWPVGHPGNTGAGLTGQVLCTDGGLILR